MSQQKSSISFQPLGCGHESCHEDAYIKQDPGKKKCFGHLPMMAAASCGSIGGFLASRFCE
jgi:hypothetical protein